MSPTRALRGLLLSGWLVLPLGPALFAAAPPAPDDDCLLLRKAGVATNTTALLGSGGQKAVPRALPR
jgi:hypothetical protein